MFHKELSIPWEKVEESESRLYSDINDVMYCKGQHKNW